ncbi:MAG: alpha/beta fold hydrolase [Bacteroidota bacterium]
MEHSFYYLSRYIWLVCFSLLQQALVAQEAGPAVYFPEQVAVSTQPITLQDDNFSLRGEEGIMLVQENRNNPASRLISVHFFRFYAKNDRSLPPVFYLPGGPGSDFERWEFFEDEVGERGRALSYEISLLNENRDVIIVNQRGKSKGYAGLPFIDFRFSYAHGARYEPLDRVARYAAIADAFDQRCTEIEAMGVDLQGYDFYHLIDDVEQLRRHFGYDQIALVGHSFGSQWALGYHRRYPSMVDRLILSGIEPIELGYDDPRGLADVYRLLDRTAQNDESLMSHLPDIGLVAAVQEIVGRFSNGPIEVPLQWPSRNIDTTLLIGRDDFLSNITCPFCGYELRLAFWPKYITELYRGDYRLLALWAYERRMSQEDSGMMPELVNYSIGVGVEMDRELRTRPELEWLADPNESMRAIDAVCDLPSIGEDFRRSEHQGDTQISESRANSTPLLMLHGNLDLSTPLSNAHFLQSQFPNSHLVILEGGGHRAKWNTFLKDPEFGKRVLSFINADFSDGGFGRFCANLPKAYTYKNISFAPIEGASLFEETLEYLDR